MNKYLKLLVGSIASLMLLASCGNTIESSTTSESGSITSTTTETSSGDDTTATSTQEADPILMGIAISGEAKQEYYLGDEFVKPSIVATYDDLSSNDVTDLCTFFGYNMENVGSQQVHVAYTEKEITKTLDYNVEVKELENLLKFAVFADIQLCYYEADNTKEVTGNVGTVANAALALRDHFAYCKDQNVDAIFMVGDIVNNANQYYYDYYQSIFEGVYGTDSSKYPEIIWSVGNHEWWGTKFDEGHNEKDIDRAMSLFNTRTNLDSDCLVKKSAVKYYLDDTQTIPSFYKVVKGVPFLAVSGEDSAGKIGTELRGELESWLQEISQLPSVQAGGPIYVGYHWPLSNTQTFGHGEGKYSNILEDILKDYPQAVVYTGDTHYPGVNERSINQGEFTTINIGSSSYSRMDTMSATMTEGEHFYNLEKGGSGAKDVTNGNAYYLCEYTPTIHIVDVTSDYSSHMNRYFSNENVANVQHIGKEWLIPHGANKSSFKYTNARLLNKAAANDLYGKDGVEWAENAQVKFGVLNGKMTVKFPDTIDYHYTEHFKIKVTTNTNNTKTYDVVSNYYKYLRNPEQLYFVLEDLPSGSSYSVEVTAYDYFDNPSLNKLSSSTNDPNASADEVDTVVIDQYSDISKRINLDDYAPDCGSHSSLEYYYRGVNVFSYGASLNRYFDTALTTSGANYCSLTSAPNQAIKLRAKFKNLCDTNVVIGLVVLNGEGSWLGDFAASTRKTITPNSGWVDLEWDITELYGLVGKSSVQRLGFKANSANMSHDGYSFHLLMDDMDVYGEGTMIVENPTTTTNLEMMAIDVGWTWGTAPSVVNDTCGSTSTSARKFAFKDSTCDRYGNSLRDDDNSTDQVYIAFSPENQWGDPSGIDIRNSTLSFDVKLSPEFFNSTNTYKHMFTINIVDSTWSGTDVTNEMWFNWTPNGKYDFKQENTSDGWFHCSVNFADEAKVQKLKGNVKRIKFGAFGLNETTKTNAYLIFDNMTLTKNA